MFDRSSIDVCSLISAFAGFKKTGDDGRPELMTMIHFALGFPPRQLEASSIWAPVLVIGFRIVFILPSGFCYPSPVYQIRSREVKHSLSEHAIDAFLMRTPHP